MRVVMGGRADQTPGAVRALIWCCAPDSSLSPSPASNMWSRLPPVGEMVEASELATSQETFFFGGWVYEDSECRRVVRR